MPNEFIEHRNIGPCIFDEGDLTELISLIQDSMPEGSGFQITAKFENCQIHWASLEEFLQWEKIPGTPVEFGIMAWLPEKYYNVHEIEKDIHIDFGTLGSSLSVSGKDEIWVIGVFNRLNRFFDSKSKAINRFSDKLEKILKNDLLQSSILGLWVIGIFYMLMNVKIYYAILFAISSAYLVLRYFGWAIAWKPQTVKLNLKTKRKFNIFGMEFKDFASIGLSILALIVSVIQIFLK